MALFDYGKHLNASSITGKVTPGTAVAYFKHIVEGDELGAYTVFAHKDRNGIRFDAITEGEKATIATSHTAPTHATLGDALETIANKIHGKHTR